MNPLFILKTDSPLCPNVSTTPITAMGCRQCFPLSVVQLKGKHCRKPPCHNGVVDTFEQLGSTQLHKRVCGIMDKNWLSESGLFVHIPGYLACEFKPGGSICYDV